jgi:murein DD-endopeptidase MepM/ murein hydrolase activator NlpD
MPIPSSRRARRALLPLTATLLALTAACGPGALRERLRPATSPRESYERALADAGLDRSALGRDWVAVGRAALATPARAALPLREDGFLPAGEPAALAWAVRPRRGERLTVRVSAQGDSGTRLFAELFVATAATGGPADSTGAPRLLAASDSLAATFQLDADDEGAVYVLRLQPELLRPVRWSVTVETGPSLAFPVEGRDRGAIQSFWGADRDGGARAHQGIDIFAPRGTPVLAAAGGVAWTGDNRLGGRVVFVRDPARGHSLYYAHLDRQAVASGAVVRAGDTVGFVGNTGNARSTAPHLHFGIYRRGEGAVDPLPFVDTRVARATGPASAADVALAGRTARTRASALVLRDGPASGAERVRELGRHTLVHVDGAAVSGTGSRTAWVRVRLPDGARGYLRADAVEASERPVGRARLPAAVAVRARPTRDALPVRTVAEAVEVPVFARFGDYRLVELAGGARGWVALGD